MEGPLSEPFANQIVQLPRRVGCGIRYRVRLPCCSRVMSREHQRLDGILDMEHAPPVAGHRGRRKTASINRGDHPHQVAALARTVDERKSATDRLEPAARGIGQHEAFGGEL